MTELEAVNLVLKNMGEAPVNSLTGVLPLEAAQAHDALKETSKSVQLQGWYFNREYRTLVPSNSGFIYVPPNTLHVETVGESRAFRVTVRDGRLYNMTPFSDTGYVFEGALKVMIILGLEFVELPSSARHYIARVAARQMQSTHVGDGQVLQEDMQDEARALAYLQAEQLAAEPVSLRSAINVYDAVSGLPPLRMRL